MTFRNLAATAAVMAVVGSTACASGAGSMWLDDEPVAGDRSKLTVSNNNWSEMTIYIVRDGLRTRIGRVSSLDERSFSIPPTLISGTGEMTIMARPLASRRAFMSQRIHVSPGQHVELRLENNLNLSTFSVW